MRQDIFQAMTPNAIDDNFNTTLQSVSKHLCILTENAFQRRLYNDIKRIRKLLSTPSK